MSPPQEHQEEARNMGLLLEGGGRERSQGRENSKSICPLLPLRRVSTVRGFVALLTPQHLHFVKWGFAAEAHPSAQITISNSMSQTLYLVSRLALQRPDSPPAGESHSEERPAAPAGSVSLPAWQPCHSISWKIENQSQCTREETDQSRKRGPHAEISRSWGKKRVTVANSVTLNLKSSQ